MGDVGAPELIIILVVVLVLFGGAKLPELARSLGKAKHEFQKGVDEGLAGADSARPADTTTTERALNPPFGAPPIETTTQPAPQQASPVTESDHQSPTR